MQERLQKLIAQAGIASRRHAEEMITAGEVTVNGKVITELGTKADPRKGSHQGSRQTHQSDTAEARKSLRAAEQTKGLSFQRL